MTFSTEALHDLRQDAAFAARASLRRPGFALPVIAILAVAIAAASAMFSVVDGVILRPLPYPDPQRIMQAGVRSNGRIQVSPGDFERLAPIFDDAAISRWDSFSITGEGGAERLDGDRVTANFFRLLGAPAKLGRVFSASDPPSEVVISYGLWQRRYGGDPAIVGRKIDLNFEPYTILGVLPADFHDPEGYRRSASIDVWAPLVPLPGRSASMRLYTMQGRLPRGATVASARARMRAVDDADLQPLLESLTATARPQFLMLGSAVGLVMLIACANAAGLMLARMNTRRGEIGIRVSLGAGRGRLARQFLTESMVLTIPAAVLGFLLARALVHVALAFAPADLPRAGEIALDGRAAAFAIALAILTGIACGSVPAFRAVHRTVPRRPFASALVVLQIVASLVLVAGAALLIESFYRFTRVDLGFTTSEILTMQVRLPQTKYHDRAQRTKFYDDALRELNQIPKVRSAAMVAALPMGGSGFEEAFFIQDRPAASDAARENAEWNLISPGYFATMGIPLLAGRLPTEIDQQRDAPLVVINSALARKEWPGENPIGKRIRFGSIHDPPPWLEVMGVVGGVKQLGLEAPDDPQVYQLYPALPPPFAAFVLRAEKPALMARAAVKRIQTVDPDLPVDHIATMAGVFSRSLSASRFRALLLGGFGAIGLALAAAGIFAALYSRVELRRREIAIRMALGATPRRMVFSALGHAAALAGAGVSVGVAGAWMATRLLRNLVFGVNNEYPPPLALASAILLVTALAASLSPARRAARLDPAVTLRED
ncbi:MAG TPA: ABC transporter permease [Bryobacteraceae bacterium]|nr:ABC transporter permease [Bryobacteraceae bacterium]